MSSFLSASIGKKFIMSVSGLFLILFLAVHLFVNILLIFDDSGELYNVAANFMATNPAIGIIEPLLGLGFLVHILWSFVLEYRNWKSRPVKYNRKNPGVASSWASRNMLILGGLILVFLIIHIINFYWIMRFNPHTMDSVTINGVHMEDAYALVSGKFKASLLYSGFYVLSAILLGLHLSHGFWSAFQTLGWNNKIWMNRLKVLGKVYAIVIAAGFSIIPLYFLIKF